MRDLQDARDAIDYLAGERYTDGATAANLLEIIGEAETSRERLASLEAEVSTLRAQLAAPLRLGRAPTVTAEIALDAGFTDASEWLAGLGVALHATCPGATVDYTNLHRNEGSIAVLTDGNNPQAFVLNIRNAFNRTVTIRADLGDLLNSSRQPCPVGGGKWTL